MDWLDMDPRKVFRRWPIAFLRIYAGVFFSYYGFGKVRRDDFAQAVHGFVSANLENSFGFFRPFLEGVVLPNPAVFAVLVAWGELLLGLALLAGLATRYAAIGGAVLVAAFWFTKGQGLLAAQNHDAVWFMIFVVLAGVHAGRVFGLDARLARRWPLLA